MSDVMLRSPFGDLNTRLSRLFDDSWMRSLFPADLEDGALAVDVSENDREVTVRASVPGYAQDEIEVQLDAGVLSIKAHHEEEHEEKDAHFYRRERFAGALSRRIALPGGIADTADVQADLDKGVLTVHVPKSDKAQPKKIEIKAAP
jgi:HSP20 family protein